MPGITRTPNNDGHCRNSEGYALLMTTVRLPTSAITDWDSFHAICQETFGFPSFYGRNMNAWIDCLTYLDLGDGMSRFHLRLGEQLIVEIPGTKDLMRRVPDVVAGLIEGTAAVNQGHIDDGKTPMITLVFL